jgi:hypothetical protein
MKGENMAVGGEGQPGTRAKIKWPVEIRTTHGSSEGVTLELGTDGGFVRCAKPLKLNQVFDMVINAPDQQIKATAEVVWSNIYGPDDSITPRGMGIRFLNISSAHRKVIAKEVLVYLKSEKADPRELEVLHTIMLEADELPED